MPRTMNPEETRRFLPAFRKAATAAIGYHRADMALQDLSKLSPKEQTSKINEVCDRMAQGIQAANNPAADKALEKLFSDMLQMRFVQEEYASLVQKIKKMLAEKNEAAKKEACRTLLLNGEVRELFAAMTASMMQQKKPSAADFSDLIDRNTKEAADVFHQAAQQQAYSPEGILVSGLVRIFFQLFDMLEIAAGKEPLSAPSDGSDSAERTKFMPMPGGR